MKRLELDIDVDQRKTRTFCDREELVKEMFGISTIKDRRVLHRNLNIPAQGLIYITGYSGTGKSCLLRKIKERLPTTVTSIPDINEEKSVLNSLSAPVSETIQWLSQFGLGEAHILLTPVKHISVGQRQRLNLAVLLWSRPSAVIIDEFLAALDRTTARNIAFQFQKLVRRLGITCFVATAHDDLVDALFADCVVRLDFEGNHRISEKTLKRQLREKDEIEIRDGILADYDQLKRFHYMDSQIGDELMNPKDIIAIRTAIFRSQVVGVRVFTKIFPYAYEKMPVIKLINERSALSSRVIVHPVFRGLGISSLMDFPFRNFPHVQAVFTHSALARHFPFDAKNYRPTVHTSETKTAFHDQFENHLQLCGLENRSDLNDVQKSREFWQGLSPELQSELRQRLSQVLSDYDTRYFQYVAKELHMKIPPAALQSLQDFFAQKIQRIPDQFFGSMLSEGLHFPMQGLVRHQSGVCSN